MNVRELRAALDGVDDELEIAVGYEGTYNTWGVYAEPLETLSREPEPKLLHYFLISTV